MSPFFAPMRHFFHYILIMVLGFGVISAVLAADRLSIKTILDRPTEYRAKVVTVEGRAKAITNLPVHPGTRHCGGGAVYDSQRFVLKDESGTIGIATTGTCRPNATQPVRENEHLRIHGVVVADEKDSNGLPVIYADAIERLTLSR
ncbi:MAG TPA: hypothetical protein VJR03_12475 [Nitrospira sp.]|nr:hypothetical protein [Nitrospira sp.]